MAFKYDEHDAADLSRMIRRRRPQWTQQGILKQLQLAAETGATIAQVTAAAEKTWSNPKAQTPAALNWPENWESDPKSKAIHGDRLCAYCEPPRRHPIQQMTNHNGIWMCASCNACHWASTEESGA